MPIRNIFFHFGIAILGSLTVGIYESQACDFDWVSAQGEKICGSNYEGVQDYSSSLPLLVRIKNHVGEGGARKPNPIVKNTGHQRDANRKGYDLAKLKDLDGEDIGYYYPMRKSLSRFGGVWWELEHLARHLSKNRGQFEFVIGAVKTVNSAFPSDYFAVFYDKENNALLSYIVPNEDSVAPLNYHRTSLSCIEMKSGYSLWPLNKDASFLRAKEKVAVSPEYWAMGIEHLEEAECG